MRFSIVEDDRVVNIAVADAPLGESWQENQGERIGDTWDGSQWQAPPVEVPAQVTMAQARKALIMSGITIASVDAAIDAIADATEREIAQTDWQYRDTVRRDSDLVTTLGTELGVTEQQQDDLFILAAGLDG